MSVRPLVTLSDFQSVSVSGRPTWKVEERGPKLFCQFWVWVFLTQKNFVDPKTFFDQKTFWSKIFFWPKKLFWPKNISDPKTFWPQNFFDPKNFFERTRRLAHLPSFCELVLPSPSVFVQKSLLLASCTTCISQSGRDLIFIPYRPCSCILASISYHLILSSKRIEMLQNGSMEDLFFRNVICFASILGYRKTKLLFTFP